MRKLLRRTRTDRGERTYWTADLTPRRPAGSRLRFWRDVVIGGSNRGHTTDPDKANLICSRTTTGWHMPVLDMDMPHRIEPSSRPGHSHLYIDVRMPWRKYAVLLIVMRWCRILERGFVLHSLRRRGSFVRLPHVAKDGHATHTPYTRALAKLTDEEAQAMYAAGRGACAMTCERASGTLPPLGTGYLGDSDGNG